MKESHEQSQILKIIDFYSKESMEKKKELLAKILYEGANEQYEREFGSHALENSFEEDLRYIDI